MNDASPVRISYFSDILCIWAYVAQVRVDEIKKRFGPQVAWDYHFISVFGDTEEQIGHRWRERGGFAGYGRHVREVADRFDHVVVNDTAWDKTRPASSAGIHLFLKAVELCEAGEEGGAPVVAATGPVDPVGPAGSGQTALEDAAWRLRLAFFRDGRNIAHAAVQMAVAEELSIPRGPLEACLGDGRAFAALCRDYAAEKQHKIDGSPTFLLNEGRQKLYGNVGYRVIEANLQELMHAPDLAMASWC